MAAPIRLVGGIRRHRPDPRRDEGWSVRMDVTVGKSDTLRPIELDEAALIRLASDALEQLDWMRRTRELEAKES